MQVGARVALGQLAQEVVAADADDDQLRAVLGQQRRQPRQRLRALDAVRPKAPLPKGPMPTPKGINRAMRGR